MEVKQFFELARLELKEQGFWLGDWLTNFKTYNVGDCLHGDSNGGHYGE